MLESAGDRVGRRAPDIDEFLFEDPKMEMPIHKIIDEAKRKKMRIRWVEPDDCGYEKSRSIVNARFSHRPAAIAYCETVDSVAGLFRIFDGKAPKIRVRSGGHQHEGMCSADGVLLVDLSELNRIGWDPRDEQYQKVDPDLENLWIQPGVFLGDVYRKLEACWKTLPGGVCFHVRVGGLVQGGGWGHSVRKHGLTCDNLIEAEVVLASGEKVFASETENQDLFWAIRGGGGGNFGVVTNCKFHIRPLADTMTIFGLRWTRKHRLNLVREWMKLQSSKNKNLTTFGRLPVIPSGSDEPAFFIGGQFYGPKRELRELLEPFYAIAEPLGKEEDHYREKRRPSKTALETVVSSEASTADTAVGGGSLTSHLAELIADLQPQAPATRLQGGRKAPTSRCTGRGGEFQPHPHKVSSAFPKSKGDYDQLAKDLIEVVHSTQHDPEVNLYVGLHGFGGKVADTKKNATAFAYRDKEFIVQFQAWWSDPASGKSKDYVHWIEDFRKKLKGVEGAFINFPDISLVANEDGERVQLLQHYYGGNLPKLRKIKAEVDPRNVFSFGMSIPPA